MRPLIVIAAGVGIGVVATLGTRLVGSIGHVTTIASALPKSSAGTGHEPAFPAAIPATRLETAIAGFAAQIDAEEPGLADAPASASDEQVMQWLAADPELQRAADELLRDPDPAVRRDARAFLREIGAAVPADDGER